MKGLAWFIIYWLWWTLCLRRNKLNVKLNVTSTDRHEWDTIIAMRYLAHILDQGKKAGKRATHPDPEDVE